MLGNFNVDSSVAQYIEQLGKTMPTYFVIKRSEALQSRNNKKYIHILSNIKTESKLDFFKSVNNEFQKVVDSIYFTFKRWHRS